MADTPDSDKNALPKTAAFKLLYEGRVPEGCIVSFEQLERELAEVNKRLEFYVDAAHDDAERTSLSAELNNALAPGERKPGEIAERGTTAFTGAAREGQEQAQPAEGALSSIAPSVDQLTDAYAEASKQHIRECGHCKGGAHIAGLKAVVALASPSHELPSEAVREAMKALLAAIEAIPPKANEFRLLNAYDALLNALTTRSAIRRPE
jgi:hypothetical protein